MVNDMKNKKILIVVAIIVGIMVLFVGANNFFVFLQFGHRPQQLSDKEGYSGALPKDNVLITYAYSNYAWSYAYYGEMILDDGTRYLFNCSDRESNSCRLKEKKAISKSDLNKMRKYEDQLTDLVTRENQGADMGEVSIVYYKNGEGYTLTGKGDNLITNESSGAKKILKVLLKYGVYV